MKWNRCRRLPEVSLLAAGALGQAEKIELERHLAECQECRIYYAEIKELVEPLGAWEKSLAGVEVTPAMRMRWASAVKTQGVASAEVHLNTAPLGSNEPLSLALSPLRGARESEAGLLLGTHATDGNLLKFEPDASGSYRVTMPVLVVASDYLAFTESVEPQFTIIRQALQRPVAQMKGDYSKPEVVPIPRFVTMRIFAQTLGARAQCHFLLNQPDEALRDLTLLNDLCHPVMEENAVMTLVSAMVNGAVRGLYADTIARGWRLHAWRDPQWAALEEQLKQVNVVAPVKTAFEFEREATTFNLENANGQQVIGWLTEIAGAPKPSPWATRKRLILGELLPRGWIYQNIVTHCDLSTNLIAGLDPAGGGISLEKVAAWQKQYDAVFGHWSPYSFNSKVATPNFTRACQTIAQNQTKINQALIVCALERCRLAQGAYPETLGALVPQFLDKIPHDVIGGQPPHYRRDGDGKFMLYSVGWSGRDGGGVAGATNTVGDWVWPNL